MPTPLLERLRAHLSASTCTAFTAPEALESILLERWQAAREAWPEVPLDEEVFASRLAACVDGRDDPLATLGELRVPDLYLAWACLEGDSRALARFEREFAPTIAAALARLRIGNDAVEELLQALREQLFVATPKRGSALLGNYSGRGQLRNWLRIIAVRTAGKFLDKGRREVQMSESMLGDLGGSSGDPELEHLKRTYRGAFRGAFERALGDLDQRDRLLLAHTYVDRLNVDEIGAIYKVHRATAARRVARARETLLKLTRQILMREIKVDRHEYDSIMRLIESQLPVTFSKLTAPDLAPDDGGEAEGS